MDRLKKLLTEAKSTKDQINVIAEAICEDPDININVEQLVVEGVIDTLTAARAHVAAIGRFLASKPERALHALSKESGIPVDKLRTMSTIQKNQVILDLMAQDLKKQGDAMGL